MGAASSFDGRGEMWTSADHVWMAARHHDRRLARVVRSEAGARRLSERVSGRVGRNAGEAAQGRVGRLFGYRELNCNGGRQ